MAKEENDFFHGLLCGPGKEKWEPFRLGLRETFIHIVSFFCFGAEKLPKKSIKATVKPYLKTHKDNIQPNNEEKPKKERTISQLSHC